MPKIIEQLPDGLRPYNFHGLDIQWRKGTKDATCECIFCGAEGKFGIVAETSQYRCVKCSASGNAGVFVRELLRLSEESTTDYEYLRESRGLVLPDTLVTWGICRSIVNGDWLIPGYNAEGKTIQAYRYASFDGGKPRAIPTPVFGHQLFHCLSYDPTKPVIDLLEGPWDGLALYEIMGKVKEESEGVLQLTANARGNLLQRRNVLAIPGCGTFPEAWVGLFADKIVNLWCQNDHPGRNPKTGEPITPASYGGMQRIARMLMESDKPPLEINYCYWGDEGYDLAFPHGYDIRDSLISSGSTLEKRLEGFVALENRLRSVPASWLGETSGSKKKAGKSREELELIPCSDWKTLTDAWKNALTWIDGLEVALSTMLASVTSTMAVGDQLWIQVISPPSTGKSVLCEAISSNKKYVLAKSTIRGFHSGFGNGDGEDNSLLKACTGKTLVTKDGDTLLQSPNLGQILAEARDVYDTVSRTHYRNKQSKNYEGVRMTWILCGTSSLLSLDTSELGERFLKCIIMDGIDDDLEDEILLGSARSAARNVSLEAGKDANTKDDPTMLTAVALTGGYVDYLRKNASDLLSAVEISHDALWLCTRFGKFVAYMRARPSVLQEEHSEREFASRLVKQITRLAFTTAVVLNKTEVDGEVLRRVKKITLDTSRGIVLTIMTYLYYLDEEGCQVSTMSLALHKTDQEIRTLLKFLRHIGAVEIFQPEGGGTRKAKNSVFSTW